MGVGFTKRHAACCRTGSSSIPARSRTTSASCPPPGTPRRQREGPAGAYEACLIDNPVADPEKPLELRTVHSFDPCLACAVHVVDQENNWW